MLRIIVMLDFGPSEDIHGKLKRLIHLSSLNNDDLELIQSNIPLRIFALTHWLADTVSCM